MSKGNYHIEDVDNTLKEWYACHRHIGMIVFKEHIAGTVIQDNHGGTLTCPW